jgi:hypothetical protein
MSQKEAIMEALKTLEGKTGRGALARILDEDILEYMERLNREGVSYSNIAIKLSETTTIPLKPMQVMFAVKKYRERNARPQAAEKDRIETCLCPTA